MKTIYLVGKFNEDTQKLNKFLSGYFIVQLCSDKYEMLKGVMKMKVPDMVIISLSGMDNTHVRIFTELYLNYPKTPVACIGTESDIIGFDQYISYGKFIPVKKPFDNRDLLELVNQKTGAGDGDTEKLENRLTINSEDPEAAYSRIVESQKGQGFNHEEEPDGRKTILLIDDNATQLRATKGIFPEKYDVRMATSAAEALMIIGKKKPDLIFLDYDMPVCDGRMTLEMIRNVDEAKHTPVVFLTGYSDRSHINSVISLKPAGYLLKPANPEQIMEITKRILK